MITFACSQKCAIVTVFLVRLNSSDNMRTKLILSFTIRQKAAIIKVQKQKRDSGNPQKCMDMESVDVERDFKTCNRYDEDVVQMKPLSLFLGTRGSPKWRASFVVGAILLLVQTVALIRETIKE